jgi:hypothetical protein
MALSVKPHKYSITKQAASETGIAQIAIIEYRNDPISSKTITDTNKTDSSKVFLTS